MVEVFDAGMSIGAALGLLCGLGLAWAYGAVRRSLTER